MTELATDAPEYGPDGLEIQPDEHLPAASGSLLEQLRKSRDQAEEQAVLDLRVPRHQLAVHVRCKPLPNSRIAAVKQRADKSKDEDAIVIGNATIVAEACQGLFILTPDGEEVSLNDADPHGDWLRFDARLGEALGVQQHGPFRAVPVVRALYLTDGDIARAAAQIVEFSGFSEEKDARGN